MGSSVRSSDQYKESIGSTIQPITGTMQSPCIKNQSFNETQSSGIFMRSSTPTRRMTSSHSSAPSNNKGEISIRVDQPVEGCDVTPHAFFRSEDGDINDADVKLTYRWFRSSLRRVCANEKCPGDIDGNRAALMANIECITCIKLGISRKCSCFCSSKCFQSVWPVHKILHEKHPLIAELFSTATEQYPSLDSLMDGSANREDTWTEISNTRSYRPTSSDVGFVLQVECIPVSVNGEPCGKSKCLETNIVLPVPPLQPVRPMISLPGTLHRNIIVSSIDCFRVVSYNILAEIYATRQMYPYCPIWALSWRYRKHILIRELMSYKADIICLQEAQADHYENFLYPSLYEQGYEGLYKQKTREAFGLEGKVDGCALFFKRDKFSVREQYVVEFNQAAHALAKAYSTTFALKTANPTPAESEKHKAHVNRTLQRLLRDNIAQVVVLEKVGGSCTATDRKSSFSSLICIANTHIFSNPEFPDVKLWQTLTLIRELEKLTISRRLPLILCGDFNSEPHSAVYEMLSRRSVSPDHPDLRNDPSNILMQSNLTHNVHLVSAYSAVLNREPEYTNYTGHWIGVVDYIWFSPSLLNALAACKVHNPEVLRAQAKTALPNCQFPSDHVPLCVDFTLSGR